MVAAVQRPGANAVGHLVYARARGRNETWPNTHEVQTEKPTRIFLLIVAASATSEPNINGRSRWCRVHANVEMMVAHQRLGTC